LPFKKISFLPKNGPHSAATDFAPRTFSFKECQAPAWPHKRANNYSPLVYSTTATDCDSKALLPGPPGATLAILGSPGATLALSGSPGACLALSRFVPARTIAVVLGRTLRTNNIPPQIDLASKVWSAPSVIARPGQFNKSGSVSPGNLGESHAICSGLRPGAGMSNKARFYPEEDQPGTHGQGYFILPLFCPDI